MRQMRLAKREVKDPDSLRSIVETCQVVRIGVVDEDGMFIVPVNFGYEWDEEALRSPSGARTGFAIYIHSARDGRKAEAFMHGGRVAFEMDQNLGVIRGDYSCAYSCSYRSIMGSGRIALVEDPGEKRRALSLIMAHNEPGSACEFVDEAVERVAVFRIDVDEFSGKQRMPK